VLPPRIILAELDDRKRAGSARPQQLQATA
jgi:hypothetical protein